MCVILYGCFLVKIWRFLYCYGYFIRWLKNLIKIQFKKWYSFVKYRIKV